jgi:hypothetical protein
MYLFVVYLTKQSRHNLTYCPGIGLAGLRKHMRNLGQDGQS